MLCGQASKVIASSTVFYIKDLAEGRNQWLLPDMDLMQGDVSASFTQGQLFCQRAQKKRITGGRRTRQGRETLPWAEQGRS